MFRKVVFALVILLVSVEAEKAQMSSSQAKEQKLPAKKEPKAEKQTQEKKEAAKEEPHQKELAAPSFDEKIDGMIGFTTAALSLVKKNAFEDLKVNPSLIKLLVSKDLGRFIKSSPNFVKSIQAKSTLLKKAASEVNTALFEVELKTLLSAFAAFKQMAQSKTKKVHLFELTKGITENIQKRLLAAYTGFKDTQTTAIPSIAHGKSSRFMYIRAGRFTGIHTEAQKELQKVIDESTPGNKKLRKKAKQESLEGMQAEELLFWKRAKPYIALFRLFDLTLVSWREIQREVFNEWFEVEEPKSTPTLAEKDLEKIKAKPEFDAPNKSDNLLF